MNTIYLFDVDGTLTPPRQPMEAEFETFFRGFVSRFPVYLISGSDYSKLQEQVPQDILVRCNGVFGCSGAQFFEKGEFVFSKEHEFPKQLTQACEIYIDMSAYPVRTGTHIEQRPGMLNISVVGRQATVEQRRHYHEWDEQVGERARFVEQVNKSGLPYEASAGGEISVDIVPRGWNKSVAKREVLSREPSANLLFFGDRICPGGNDMPLASALTVPGEPHAAVSVKNHHETLAHLRALQATNTMEAA